MVNSIDIIRKPKWWNEAKWCNVLIIIDIEVVTWWMMTIMMTLFSSMTIIGNDYWILMTYSNSVMRKHYCVLLILLILMILTWRAVLIFDDYWSQWSNWNDEENLSVVLLLIFNDIIIIIGIESKWPVLTSTNIEDNGQILLILTSSIIEKLISIIDEAQSMIIIVVCEETIVIDIMMKVMIEVMMAINTVLSMTNETSIDDPLTVLILVNDSQYYYW